MADTLEHSPLKQRVGAALLATYALVVGLSGVAWPIGRGQWSAWPFNRAWFVFHREDGFYYHLRFFAAYADGRRDEVSLDPWFRAPGSEDTRRYDELSRDRDTLQALVAYACAQHNATAAPSERWSAVTVTDTVWRQTRGRRVSFRDAPYTEKRETEQLSDEPCPVPRP